MTTARPELRPVQAHRRGDRVAARARPLPRSAARAAPVEALGGAGMLLRALGVQPLMDAFDSFERTGSRVWSEEDGLH